MTLSAALETLSFVLGMRRSSFRWLAGRVYPCPGAGKLTAVALAIVVAAALAGCGGGQKKSPPRYRAVAGSGVGFDAPAAWAVHRATARVWAAPRGGGQSLVGVSRFRLLKPYRPARFAQAARELDRVAARFAAALHGRVVASRTIRVGGARVRQYDVAYRSGARLVQRTTFVLRGREEYMLTCRYRSGSQNPLAGACARFLASFRLRG